MPPQVFIDNITQPEGTFGTNVSDGQTVYNKYYYGGKMKIKVVLVCILILTVGVTTVRAGINDELKKDVMQISDGKMIAEEYGLYKIDIKGYKPLSKQFKFHAEAANTGFISRDQFVTTYTIMKTYFLKMMFADVYNVKIKTFMEGSSYKELDEPIGNVDFEINLYMNKLGIQVEMINGTDNTTKRNTITWEEMDK